MFTETKNLNQVAEFMRTFAQPVLEKPTIPSIERCNLRVDLIQEELNELRAGIYSNDIVEIADALCDLQYVLSGAIHEFGLGNKFAELFEEVHRSNMSKVCISNNEAEDTIAKYRKEGVVVYKEPVDEINTDKYLIKRSYDDKVLKSINYSPANLKPIINK